MNSEEILNPVQAATFLQLKKSTVLQYASRGDIPSVKKNRRRFFIKSQLVAHLLVN